MYVWGGMDDKIYNREASRVLRKLDSLKGPEKVAILWEHWQTIACSIYSRSLTNLGSNEWTYFSLNMVVLV